MIASCDTNWTPTLSPRWQEFCCTSMISGECPKVPAFFIPDEILDWVQQIGPGLVLHGNEIRKSGRSRGVEIVRLEATGVKWMPSRPARKPEADPGMRGLTKARRMFTLGLRGTK